MKCVQSRSQSRASGVYFVVASIPSQIVLGCGSGGASPFGVQIDNMLRLTRQISAATRSLLGTNVAVAMHRADRLYVADMGYLSLHVESVSFRLPPTPVSS